MSFLRVMVKRSRRKKQEEETEKQQHVIVTENNLFKDFTAEGVRNFDQKQSCKHDNGVARNSSRCGRFMVGRFAAPSSVAFKLAGLLSIVISNTLCSKTFKLMFFSHNNLLLFLCFYLLLLTITRREDISNIAFLCDYDSSLHQ